MDQWLTYDQAVALQPGTLLMHRYFRCQGLPQFWTVQEAPKVWKDKQGRPQFEVVVARLGWQGLLTKDNLHVFSLGYH